MKSSWIFLALGAVTASTMLTGCNKAEAQTTRVKTQSELELLIYSGGFSMIEDRRDVELNVGINRVGLTGVSKQLDQDSVMFSWPEKKDIEVRSSTYDLGTTEDSKLLSRYLGREIELVYRSDAGRETERVTGTLEVADSGNLVVRIDGKLVVNPRATIELPPDADVVTIPQLSAEIEAKTAGKTKMSVAYLTGGLSWNADYTLVLPADSQQAELECWASVKNDSGTDYPNAKVKFVAGQPNMAMTRTRNSGVMMSGGSMGYTDTSLERVMRRPAIQTLGEFHAFSYPYESKATIKQNQINRVKMMSAPALKVKRYYEIGLDSYSGGDSRIRARMGINFTNDKASGMGDPVPAGTVRVYEPNAAGTPQYVGASGISDTPKDARVSLSLSNVFDIYAVQKVGNTKPLSKKKWQVTSEHRLHNEKSRPIEVRVTMYVPAKAVILSESAKSLKLPRDRRQWKITIPAGGEVPFKLSYTTGR